MILLLENDPVTARSIQQVLPGPHEALATTVEIRRRLDSAAPHTIVLGPTVPESAVLDLTHAVRLSHPAIGVIAVRNRIDTATLAALLRAGARDALATHELELLGERVAASSRTTAAILGESEASGPMRASGRVIAVYSPKGGAGKTTVSTNLAAALAAQGKRVCLLDFDLAFGDAALVMGLSTDHHLGEAIELGERLDAAAFTGLLAAHGSGVSVLPAPINPIDVERIDVSLLDRVMDLAANQFDFVLIDTAPVLDDRTVRILERSDSVFAVTTLDVAAIKNLKVGMDTLRALSFPMDSIKVLLNRADSKVGLDPQQVPALLHSEVICSIPSSREVPEAANQGDVLAKEKPRHPVSAAILALAETQTTTGTTPALTPAAQTQPVRGSFSWRLTRRMA